MKRMLKRTPSPKITPEMAAAIRRMRDEGLYTQQIAAEFGINQGRISDVMAGRIHPNVPPANNDQLPFDFG